MNDENDGGYEVREVAVLCPRCKKKLETVFTIEESEILFDVVSYEICRSCKLGFRGGIVESFETYEEAKEFIEQELQSVVEDLSDYDFA